MSKEQAAVWKMMRDLDYCMLVTRARGALRSRPMSSIVMEDEGKVYFLTDRLGAKDDEIAADSDVLLTYSNGSNLFVSTEAKATVSEDRALIERLWNPGAQVFWPKGPDDPNVVAIQAVPGAAEYWQGPSGPVASVKMMAAMVTRSPPDLGRNEKTRL